MTPNKYTESFTPVDPEPHRASEPTDRAMWDAWYALPEAQRKQLIAAEGGEINAAYSHYTGETPT